MTTKKLLGAVIAAAASLGLAGGVAVAAGPPDKSGGTTPVRLTLLNSDTDLSGLPAVQRFVDRVAKLSEGRLTIDVRLQNDGHAGFERRVVRDVVANKAQLAWVGSRVWDTLGVTTFRALQAPMLIDSYALEAAVLRSDLPAKMLAGLDGHGVVGLALLGDNLRYPASVKRPLEAPADFEGVRIRSMTSATQAAALRALGARPSGEGWAELLPALKSGRLDALEVDLNTYEGNVYASITPFVTVNLALWPRTTVLFANESALDELSDQQKGWLTQAADDAARYSLTTFGEDQRIVQLECRNGMKAVVASHAQLEALRRAFSPVYASLRKDPATARMITAISALKKTVTPVALTVPRGCAVTRQPSGARVETFPEGVYRFKRSREDILRVWPNADPASLQTFSGTLTFTFRHGAFSGVLSGGGTPGCRRGDGRYSVRGRVLTATWTDFHGCPFLEAPSRTVRLRWTYDDKVLRFEFAQPATPSDRVTWESNPFVRIR